MILLGGCMYLYKIDNYEQAVAFEKWAEENNISFEELCSDNYLDSCPECKEYEHWHSGHCGNCGYSI